MFHIYLFTVNWIESSITIILYYTTRNRNTNWDTYWTFVIIVIIAVVDSSTVNTFKAFNVGRCEGDLMAIPTLHLPQFGRVMRIRIGSRTRIPLSCSLMKIRLVISWRFLIVHLSSKLIRMDGVLVVVVLILESCA